MVKGLRIGAVLAVGVLVAGVSACSSGGPPTTGLTKLWSATQAAGTANPEGAAGTWITGGLLIVGTGNGLTARSLRTGHTEWSWNPPAAPSGDDWTVGMLSGPSTSNEVGIVNYSLETPASAPDYQAGIDLADGRMLWRNTVDQAVNVELPGNLTGDGVMAAMDERGNSKDAYIAATSLATGKPAWSTASQQGLKGCGFTGLAFSGALAYGLATCPVSSSSPTGTSYAVILYGLSASTGAVESKVTLNDQSCTTNTLGSPTLWAASSYLLIGCPGGETEGQQQVVVIRPGSSRQIIATYSTLDSALDYPESDDQQYPPYFTVGTMLYLPVNDSKDDTAVTAISLTSGKQLWQKEPPGLLVGADGSGALIADDSLGAGDTSLGNNSPSGSLSTAAMSATSGTVSDGPGASFDITSSRGYELYFTGHTLIVMVPGQEGGGWTIVAYGTGSWPG